MNKVLVTFLIVIAIIIGLFVYWNTQTKPLDPNDASTKMFVINKGASVREIGNNLKSEKLIKDPVAFFIYIKLNGMDRAIQAGDYKLSPSMTLSEIIEELNHGVVDLWVTFPEGVRGEEIADILQKNVPSYEDNWRESLNANEGYLFPDTYLIPRDATVEMVISIMKNNLFKKIEPLGLSENDPRLSEALNIASLIEREAITNEEKPLISGVIKNRLDIGMALQIDASIQYAKGYDKSINKWWGLVYRDDYKGVDSVYNTYLKPGLPPTPIANPGIEAIKAALNPESHDYLYYIHDKNKQIHPAKTIEQHNANVSRYL